MKRKLAAMITGFVLAFTILMQTGTVFADTSDKEGIGGFVARVYKTVMERDYDPEGYEYWTKGLSGGKLTAAELVEFFVCSDEFVNKGTTNEQYVNILYHAMMDRDSDPDGLSYWVGSLDTGMTRRKALALFTGSDEFTGICKSYGVRQGKVKLTDPVDIYSDKTGFVMRIYKSVLQRDADSDGLHFWTEQLLNGCSAVDFVFNFFDSPEFKARGLSDREYIACLYRAFLGREGGDSELDNWLNHMTTHMLSRRLLFTQVAYSQEFMQYCESVGIVVGNLPLVEARDTNAVLNDYVINAFEAILGRKPSVDDLNYWDSQLLGNMTAKQFIKQLLGTQEFKDLKKNNVEYIDSVYRAAFGRVPSNEEASWQSSQISKNGKGDFLDFVFESEEFAKYCKHVGVAAIFPNGWSDSLAGRVYSNGDGLVSGWQTIDGQRYYFDPNNGKAMVKGWKYIDGLKYFFADNGVLCQDVRDIIGPQSSYYLTVNCTTNTVMVYAKGDDGGFNVPVKAFICSSSANQSTPSGTFTIQRLQAWRELQDKVYGQYCSRITGNYLFHSVWYYQNGNPNSQSVRQFRNLGKSVSHGCIRLTVADAKWIFENCNGSQVRVFYSSEGAPFDRPVPPEITAISGDYGHDPTDIWS